VCRKYGTGCFVACGRQQGLLTPELGSIFEKLLHQKTFRTCSHWICAWIFEHNFDEGKAKKQKHTIVW
jgi:hypothetical protein